LTSQRVVAIIAVVVVVVAVMLTKVPLCKLCCSIFLMMVYVPKYIFSECVSFADDLKIFRVINSA
jgi:hypothetical protein